MKTIITTLSIFVSCPIWYYLLYKILIAVHATELMMFLFWIYVPVNIFINALVKIYYDKEN